MSDEEEEFSGDFSASEDEWKPAKQHEDGESSDDDDSDFEGNQAAMPGKVAGACNKKRSVETKARSATATTSAGIRKRKQGALSLRAKLYNKYRPPPRTISSPSASGNNSPSASTSRTASKNAKTPNESGEANDDSSSDSSVENYLVDPAALDFKSSFFAAAEQRVANASRTPTPVFDCYAGMKMPSDSDSEDNNESSADEQRSNTNAFDFHTLLKNANNLERAKHTIAKRAAEKLAKSTNSAEKQHNKSAAMDVNSLLALGEKQNEQLEEKKEQDDKQKLKKTKSTRIKRQTKTRPTSALVAGDTDDSDCWEEVADGSSAGDVTLGSSGLHSNNIDSSIEIHVELPTRQRKKETKTQQDIEMALKRKLNNQLRSRQLLLHKTSLLCWFARGYSYNRLLNDSEMMQAALKFLPSKNAYPPERGTEIKYFQSLVVWFKTVIKLTNSDQYAEHTPATTQLIKQELLLQLKRKQARCKQEMVFLFIILARAMGLQCRLVLNMQPLPLRPAQSDLLSLKSEINDKAKQQKPGEAKSETTSKKKEAKTTTKANSEQKQSKTAKNVKSKNVSLSSSNEASSSSKQASSSSKQASSSSREASSSSKEASSSSKQDSSSSKQASSSSKEASSRSKQATKNVEKKDILSSPSKEASSSSKQASSPSKEASNRSKQVSSRSKQASSNSKEALNSSKVVTKNVENKTVSSSPSKQASNSSKQASSSSKQASSSSKETQIKKVIIIKPKTSKNEAKVAQQAQQNSSKENEELVDKESEIMDKTKESKQTKDVPSRKASKRAHLEEQKSDDDEEVKKTRAAVKVAAQNDVRKKEAATSSKAMPKVVVTKSAAEEQNVQRVTRSRSRSVSPKVHISTAFLETKAFKEKFSADAEQQNVKAKAAVKAVESKKDKIKVSFDFCKATTTSRVLRKRKNADINGNNTEEQSTASCSQLKVPQLDGAADDFSPKKSSKQQHEHENCSDEDFEPSPTKQAKKAPTLPKAVQKLRAQDRRVLSTDDEEATTARKTKRDAADVWAELWSDVEEQWICIDLFKGKVHCAESIRKSASNNLSYVYAFQSDLSIKDVTARYAVNWASTLRKNRVEKSWLDVALRAYLARRNQRDKREDEQLRHMHEQRPLPTSISEFKDHPLYVLERHLLKFQAIYPPDPPTLGFIRGEAVYARDCVHTLHSREIWLKSARTVKLGEQPYKVVKARPKWDKLTQSVIKDQPLEIFGYWQTQDYEPPTAENGIVPRNAYGNVELFKECMLPKKCVHLRFNGLNRVCKKLGIDCANAVIGFDFHQGSCHPLYDGFVICEEFAETATAAWLEDQDNQEKREQEKYETRVYGNWKKLIRGLLIRERLKKKYNF